MKRKIKVGHVLIVFTGLVLVGATLFFSYLDSHSGSEWQAVQAQAEKAGMYSLTFDQICAFPPPGEAPNHVAEDYATIGNSLEKDASDNNLASIRTMLADTIKPKKQGEANRFIASSKKAPKITVSQYLVSHSDVLDRLSQMASQTLYGATLPTNEKKPRFYDVLFKSASYVKTCQSFVLLDAAAAAKDGDATRFNRDLMTATEMANQVTDSRFFICQILSSTFMNQVSSLYQQLFKEGNINPAEADGFIQAASIWKEPNPISDFPGEFQSAIQGVEILKTEPLRNFTGDDSYSISPWMAVYIKTGMGQSKLKTLVAKEILSQFDSARACISNPLPNLQWVVKPTFPQAQSELGSIALMLVFDQWQFQSVRVFQLREQLTALAILSEAFIEKSNSGRYPSQLPWPSAIHRSDEAFQPGAASNGFPAVFTGTLGPRSYPNLTALKYEVLTGKCGVTYPTIEFGESQNVNVKESETRMVLKNLTLTNGQLTENESPFATK